MKQINPREFELTTISWTEKKKENFENSGNEIKKYEFWRKLKKLWIDFRVLFPWLADFQWVIIAYKYFIFGTLEFKMPSEMEHFATYIKIWDPRAASHADLAIRASLPYYF